MDKKLLQALLEKINEASENIAELINDIASANDGFFCTECIRTIDTLLDIYEGLTSEDDRAELATVANHTIDSELFY